MYRERPVGRAFLTKQERDEEGNIFTCRMTRKEALVRENVARKVEGVVFSYYTDPEEDGGYIGTTTVHDQEALTEYARQVNKLLTTDKVHS